jgi:hypothetical protein
MGDLYSHNRTLHIKRHEHMKMVAQANIQAREIRIMELEEEILRNREDMDAQRKVIEEAERNIKQQLEEVEKEKKLQEAQKKQDVAKS